MYWIEGIKEIFWKLFAALSIVEIYKQECKRGSIAFKQSQDCSGNTLPQAVVFKFI